jgi:hypothetical protein
MAAGVDPVTMAALGGLCPLDSFDSLASSTPPGWIRYPGWIVVVGIAGLECATGIKR